MKIEKITGIILAVAFLMSCSSENTSNNIFVNDFKTTNEAANTLTKEEMNVLYKMREPNNRVSGTEIVKLIDNVIGILDEDTGLKSGNGRKVGSILPLVSENFKTIALKSGEDPDIEIPDTLAYVVNFEDELGFAIISADTRVDQPILGFFDNGSLKDTIDNPGLAIALEGLENYMLYSIVEAEEQKDSLLDGILEKTGNEEQVKSSVPVISFEITSIDYKILNHIGPLLPVEWGQGAPYNNNVGGTCSNKTGNNKYWAGCVATSVAQIMAYWKYPAKIDNDSFNWIEMNKYRSVSNPNSYLGTISFNINQAPTTVKSQIAALFQKIGTGVKMNYSCEESGAATSEAVNFLKKQGYKSEDLKDFDKNTVIASLLKKRPLLAEGFSFMNTNTKIIKKEKKFFGITYYTSYTTKTDTTYSAGHSWIMDGLLRREMKTTVKSNGKLTENITVSDYVHNNWGWGSSRNGFFAIGAFNSNQAPDFASNTKSGEDYNFQYKVKVVPNIYK
ncbi:MAG: C10 family peptidase [Fibrobacter sp.]|jgi:hypothetical protein|nr:C10 family peptidase [Fibrobacter sp.]